MNKAVPVIRESADDLRQEMASARHVSTYQRLYALYLIASGQARFRNDVARLLDIDRNTVGRWLDRYARGGLEAVLERYIPVGKVPTLAPEQVAELQEVLKQPPHFGSYEEVRQWLQNRFNVALSYNATHKLVRYKLGVKLKEDRLVNRDTTDFRVE